MYGVFESSTHDAITSLLQFRDTLAIRQVYITPSEMTNPVIQVNMPRLAGYRVEAFDPADCLVIPTMPSIYIATRIDTLGGLRNALSQWGDVAALSPLRSIPGNGTRYGLLQFTPDSDMIHAGETSDLVFGDLFAVRTDLLAKKPTHRGDALSITMQTQVLEPTSGSYSVFLHLYSINNLGAIDDTRKWAQGDRQLCATYPTTMWRVNESYIQQFSVTIPNNLPAGSYAVTMGIYNTGPNGARLDETHAYGNETNSYAVLQKIKINQ